ncbi:unnamed protein product [Clonostachys solani]|uniref:Uncharacterized protein n=1 Tax=Clonostachys solani TaxID=160281 RepID=A0A9N9ZL44_9HYPO|nr:unnamed protein product [Clonostachys solani]
MASPSQNPAPPANDQVQPKRPYAGSSASNARPQGQSAPSGQVECGHPQLPGALGDNRDSQGRGTATRATSPPQPSLATASPHSYRSPQIVPNHLDDHREFPSPAWTTHHFEPNPVAREPSMTIDAPRDGSVAHLVNTTGQTGVDERTEAYRDMSWLPNDQQLPPKQPFLAPPGFTGAGITEPKFRHLDGLSDHASRCKILENWILRLCDALNPLPGILNPIRTVFTPLALEGAQEDASQSTGAVALFHMICSASGFHLSNTCEIGDERRKFERLALEHHEMGICYLRENIRTDDESQYAPILASLIICLLTEDITVNDSFWRIHIRGAVEWVNHVGVEYWYQTESASMIYQMFLCMGTLVQSQILPGDRSGYGWDLRFNLESHPGPYLIESIFGLPKPILEVIHRMNDIQKRAQEQQHPENTSADRTFSAEVLKEIDALEFELLLMMPSPWESPISIPQGKQLIYHYGYTYYYASLLYLKRTLKGVPIREVQGLVRNALQHIEALKTLEAGHSTPSLWPIANIALETHSPELRPRMLACIDFFSKQSTLLMWGKFGSSVRGLWTRRQSPGEENLSWHAYSPIFYHNYVFI